MDAIFSSPLMKLLLAGGVIAAAYKWGNAEMRIAALGAAGFIALNQIPTVRDGLNTRLVA